MKVLRLLRYVRIVQLFKVLFSVEVRKELKKVVASIKTLLADITKLASTVIITWAIK
jgi:hypothetical protein